MKYISIPFTLDDKTNSALVIPNRIGHNFIPLYAETLSHIKKYSFHRRMRVFCKHGVKCVKCGIEGHYVIVSKDSGDAIHVDLYTKDFVLMTIDHILPKSKGGPNRLDNLQPMCTNCNRIKGNKLEVKENEQNYLDC